MTPAHFKWQLTVMWLLIKCRPTHDSTYDVRRAILTPSLNKTNSLLGRKNFTIGRKSVDCRKLKCKYFCLEIVWINKTKMLIKATQNCVTNLIAKGINASNIVVQTPTVVLNTVLLQSIRVDCACQTDILSSYSED